MRFASISNVKRKYLVGGTRRTVRPHRIYEIPVKRDKFRVARLECVLDCVGIG